MTPPLSCVAARMTNQGQEGLRTTNHRRLFEILQSHIVDITTLMTQNKIKHSQDFVTTQQNTPSTPDLEIILSLIH